MSNENQIELNLIEQLRGLKYSLIFFDLWKHLNNMMFKASEFEPIKHNKIFKNNKYING